MLRQAGFRHVVILFIVVFKRFAGVPRRFVPRGVAPLLLNACSCVLLVVRSCYRCLVDFWLCTFRLDRFDGGTPATVSY